MSEKDAPAAPEQDPEGLDDLVTALRELAEAQRRLLARLTEVQQLQEMHQQMAAEAEAGRPRVLH